MELHLKKLKPGRKSTKKKQRKDLAKKRNQKKPGKKLSTKRRYNSNKFKSKKRNASKRAKSKLTALKPEFNLRSRADLIDIDDQYWKDLKDNPKAAEWLNKFNNEYVSASFNRHKKHLHKSKKLKRDCYNKNNARNRCIYTREKAQGKLNHLEDMQKELENEFIEYEEDLIKNIDEDLVMKKFEDFKKGSNESNDPSESH